MGTAKRAVSFFTAVKPRSNGRGPLLIGLWWLALLPAPASAQTAERLDAVLDAGRVSFAQAAAIVLPAAGLLAPEAGEEEAFAMARDWFPRRAEREGSIRLGEVSYLVMRSFKLSGGFMYALFPGPRYAYRALAWRRLLPPGPDPRRFLTGEELLYITGRALSLAGDAEPLDPPPPAVEAVPAVLTEEPAPEEEAAKRLELEQGQGLFSGPEEVLPYRGDFELE